MTDVVVTLPKSFGLKRWVAEGDPAGEPWSGQEWGWYLGMKAPKTLMPGERVYVVYNGRLIGYSPLFRVEPWRDEITRQVVGCVLVRGGDAVACTIPCQIRGFQGYRYRWWDQKIEIPFPGWKDELTNAATMR